MAESSDSSPRRRHGPRACCSRHRWSSDGWSPQRKAREFFRYWVDDVVKPLFRHGARPARPGDLHGVSLGDHRRPVALLARAVALGTGVRPAVDSDLGDVREDRPLALAADCRQRDARARLHAADAGRCWWSDSGGCACRTRSTLALSIIVPMSTSSLMSMPRFALVLFPMFALFGLWGARPTFSNAYVAFSLPLLGIVSPCLFAACTGA